MLLKEMDAEAVTTRKMLERIPTDKLDWRPHEKSIDMRTLATHIAELPTWVSMGINTSELDFATSTYQPTPIENSDELLLLLQRSLDSGRSDLEKTTEEELLKPWKLRNGEEVLYESNKAEVIRMTYCQIVHHRAQLGVYLRLLNIPIPGSYGPSADEH